MRTSTTACSPNKGFWRVYWRKPEYSFSRLWRRLFSLSILARISSPEGITKSAVTLAINICVIANASSGLTLTGRVLLASGLDSRHDSDACQHDGANRDPPTRNMQQSRAVGQPAD